MLQIRKIIRGSENPKSTYPSSEYAPPASSAPPPYLHLQDAFHDSDSTEQILPSLPGDNNNMTMDQCEVEEEYLEEDAEVVFLSTECCQRH